jgi:hypothetical protein
MAADSAGGSVEDNWGWQLGVDEIWHLRVGDSQGNSFSLNDFEEASFFTDVQLALKYYLGLAIEWQPGGLVDAEYAQRRGKWHRGWFASRLKPVVYSRSVKV